MISKLSIGNPVSEDRSGGKYLLERVENITAEEIELPKNILLGEICQWNDNIQVVEDEPVIEKKY